MLMTKRHQFSCQIILQGAFEEIIKQTLLFNFCFPALFPLISQRKQCKLKGTQSAGALAH